MRISKHGTVIVHITWIFYHYQVTKQNTTSTKTLMGMMMMTMTKIYISTRFYLHYLRHSETHFQPSWQKWPIFVCRWRFTTRPTSDRQAEHRLVCDLRPDQPTQYRMPSESNKWVRFRNHGRRMRVSVIIVALYFAFYRAPLYDNKTPVYGQQCRGRV